ncbi:MAG: nitroreductase family deazaflavin-dependent oxidoreductase [Actinoplanes sp.]
MTAGFNAPIIEEFRANGGKVGGWFAGARLLLLTTTGARSGRLHTVPLGYLPDESVAGRLLVVASAAGAAKHPGWYFNVLAEPAVTIEDGTRTYAARATVLDGAERDRAFAWAVQQSPGYAKYQDMTTRILPVIALSAG